MFNYKKDDEFNLEELCKEKNYDYTITGKTMVINNLLSVNLLMNSVYNLKADTFKKFNSKEPMFYYCEKELNLLSQ